MLFRSSRSCCGGSTCTFVMCMWRKDRQGDDRTDIWWWCNRDRCNMSLDEPTSGLDGRNMRLIAERLKSEARNGRTILVITHDRELIESCCDNVVEVGTKPSEVQ